MTYPTRPHTISNYFGFNSDNTPFNWETFTSDPPNGSSCSSTYIEGNISIDLLEKICFHCFQAGKLNLLLHAGHQSVRNYGNLSFTDWKVTLTQEFEWFNFFVSYVGTDSKEAYYDVLDNAFDPNTQDLGAQGVVVGIVRSF